MENNKGIDYIAMRYRDGLFKVKPALESITSRKSSWWSPFRIAAVSAAVVVISATATIAVHYYNLDNSEPIESMQPIPATTVKVIDFEETPLPTVVAKIREVYGVDVTDMPDNPEDYVLSLHYEGTAQDLVATINDILGTEMKIEE